jgi:hypothetical protein
MASLTRQKSPDWDIIDLAQTTRTAVEREDVETTDDVRLDDTSLGNVICRRDGATEDTDWLLASITIPGPCFWLLEAKVKTVVETTSSS